MNLLNYINLNYLNNNRHTSVIKFTKFFNIHQTIEKFHQRVHQCLKKSQKKKNKTAF